MKHCTRVFKKKSVINLKHVTLDLRPSVRLDEDLSHEAQREKRIIRIVRWTWYKAVATHQVYTNTQKYLTREKYITRFYFVRIVPLHDRFNAYIHKPHFFLLAVLKKLKQTNHIITQQLNKLNQITVDRSESKSTKTQRDKKIRF